MHINSKRRHCVRSQNARFVFAGNHLFLNPLVKAAQQLFSPDRVLETLGHAFIVRTICMYRRKRSLLKSPPHRTVRFFANVPRKQFNRLRASNLIAGYTERTLDIALFPGNNCSGKALIVSHTKQFAVKRSHQRHGSAAPRFSLRS